MSTRESPLRLLVLTGDHSLGDPTKWDGGYTEDDLELHREMCDAVASLPGYQVDVVSEHRRLLSRLQADPPDLVLNFCDTGLGNIATRELLVPALLEALDIPYTGAGPASMVLCYDKAIVRLVAEAHGVAVPGELFVAPDVPLADLALEDPSVRYPALVKPAQGDGSVGITRESVVESASEAVAAMERFRELLPGRAALIQEYLPGPEYGLALIGNPADGYLALPPLLVDFSALDPGCPPILAFESKTGPDNPYSAVRVVPAELPAVTLLEMRSAAELLFERLECRDYARFDFRTGADGVVRLMEINPNPAWSSAAKMALMARFAGRSYPELLSMILSTARTRLGL